jgi:CheY-like chemotaxis protein
MTKILLVEDDKSLREIYGVRLLAEGYDIVSAGDGEEALAMAIKDRPDLIVSDVMMPKISGFDMLDILRSTTETKGIKVIMMTALSSEDQRLRGVALGADRYLVKSQVGIEDVVRTVHEVLADAPVIGGASSSPTPAAGPSVSPAPTPFTQAAPTPEPPQAPAPVAPSISVPPRPVEPAAPAAPMAPPAPVAEPPATVSPLPQPTAPFSTPRPGAGTTLANRVIEPLPASESTVPDFTNMIDQELAQASPTPFEQQPSVEPGSNATNIPPAPASAIPEGLSFETTGPADLPPSAPSQTPPTLTPPAAPQPPQAPSTGL